jgi:pyruvate/2-oxoglutarate dehydrogenase complex dihydrolipoamide dehydrogenase (E3) component
VTDFPASPHDERLIAAVHPPSWTNPVPRDRYHLVVLGAGTAGLVTAAAAAGLGARVALVERHLMGGDCLNVGCVPSKGIIAAARAWACAERAHERFAGPRTAGGADFARAMERMRAIRADIAPVDGAERFRGLGIDVFLGDGRFTGPDTLTIDGATLRFRRAAIATGARAAVPAVPGLAESGHLTNDTVFNLPELPARLIVLGAGPIGCELAQSFARFGSKVTVVDMAERVLPRDDADAAAIVQRAMVEDGVRFILGASVQAVRGSARDETLEMVVGVHGVERVIPADQLLVATGRAPNVQGIGLEAAGVKFTPRGVVVDDRLRTTNPRIHAVGDVIGQHQFTHAADFHARLVVGNALFFGRSKVSRLVIPRATYTSPEVAHVGATREELTARGVMFDTVTVPLDDNDRARLEGDTEGFLAVHLVRGNDQILGATLVAPHAGDLISEMTLAITNGIGLSRFAKTIHPYPTTAEVYRRAADQWNRRKLTPRVKRVLRWWFR